ncbi:MAG UNVERIFIED_CONTAM: hypothetical protein LVQ98_06615 [Rickettsiaceae bacterium]|jgi:coproporphyrinogen III oxidase-like Fe-S oxidoreductase
MNYHKPEKWMSLIKSDNHALQTKQILNDTEILEEVMMMGLRLEDGITDGKLKKIFRQRFYSST